MKYVENTTESKLKLSNSMNYRKQQLDLPQTNQHAENQKENKTIQFVNCSNVVLNF